jgi:hypothetical protein
VSRNPDVFADYINGKKVDDGVNSIMLQLESRKENMNRNLTNSAAGVSSSSSNVEQTGDSKKKKTTKAMKYGCLRWQPALADTENIDDTVEQARQELIALYESDRESARVSYLMDITYGFQRLTINAGSSVTDIVTKWPFLGINRCIFQHVRKLTGMDVENSLRAAICAQSQNLYDFVAAEMQSNDKVKALLQSTRAAMDSTGLREPLYDCMILFIMACVREEPQSLVTFYKVHRIL